MNHKQWTYEDFPYSPNLKAWAQGHSIDPFVAKVAAERSGYNPQAIEAFLHPNLGQLRDPYLLHDMKRVVDRIHEAIQTQELITIYGDYDMDGITSTSIMYATLRELGANVNYYIPNRFTDGYGPNTDVYQRLADNGTKILFTVDNGVVAHEAIAFANKLGFTTIVTDHHELMPTLPDADYIIHTQYPGHKYPFEDFCGAGIAFKISCALLNRVDMNMMELAAMGTVADLVGLKDENRTIVSLGLKHMSNTTNLGLKDLLDITNCQAPYTATTIGFTIAPCFNALGRLKDASIGVELLTCQSDVESKRLADYTKMMNEQRKKMTGNITAQAMRQAAKLNDAGHDALVVKADDWHQGLVGIVASRMVESYGCPVLVLTRKGDTENFVGSGRSVDGFNLFESLNAVRDHMVAFGGHSMACGLTVKESEIPVLQAQLDKTFAEAKRTQDVAPKLTITRRINIDEVSIPQYEEDMELGPFGLGNPPLLYELTNFDVTYVGQMGKDGQTLNLRVKSKTSNKRMKVIAFREPTISGEMQATLDKGYHLRLVGTLQPNTYNGQTSMQMTLVDWCKTSD